jgi:flagellar protein FliO/FliZ
MNSTPQLMETLLKVLASLGVVLMVMMALFYLAKQFMSKSSYLSRNKMIRVLSSNYVGVKKQISLVQVPGSVLVLGLSGDRIQLLTKIENREIIKELSECKEDTAAPSFFARMNEFRSIFKTSKNSEVS